MESHFEQTAKRAAVEAVERRWAAKHPAPSPRGRWLAVVGILAVALAAGSFAIRQTGTSFSDLVNALVRPFIGLTNTECAQIDLFSSKLEPFGTDDIRPWKSAPQDVNPKQASHGLTYRMLVETKSGHCGLYEMVADGKGRLSVFELNPLGASVKVSMADFNRARRKGGVYLVAVNGKVYVCGSDNPEDGRAFAQRIGVRGRAD